jgi:hypothetical protein
MSISKEPPVLEAAMGYAARGWPVFPCPAGSKAPATRHGYRDATTDPGRITAWFRTNPDRNVAIATGAPGPDVLDVDQHGPGKDGYRALALLTGAGLTEGAAALVRTPSGGLHAYFAGTGQRNRHLPRHHLDFLACPLAAAARAAGLGDREVAATLNSARLTTRRQAEPQHSPEAAT